MEPTSSPPGTGPRVHVLTVRRGVATCSDRVLVQGSALDDVVVPDLDAPWEGLAVSATFSDGTESYTPPVAMTGRGSSRGSSPGIPEP